jgi:hypothetical protein
MFGVCNGFTTLYALSRNLERRFGLPLFGATRKNNSRPSPNLGCSLILYFLEDVFRRTVYALVNFVQTFDLFGAHYTPL